MTEHGAYKPVCNHSLFFLKLGIFFIYISCPPYPTTPPLPYPHTPISWPWRSLVLRHINSLQTLTLLHTLARFCWKDPDIAVSCETMSGPSKHRSGYSQLAIRWITGPPMEELEKVTKELKGSATIWTNQREHFKSTFFSHCVSYFENSQLSPIAHFSIYIFFLVYCLFVWLLYIFYMPTLCHMFDW
jgi:hypothetical protein